MRTKRVFVAAVLPVIALATASPALAKGDDVTGVTSGHQIAAVQLLADGSDVPGDATGGWQSDNQ